MLNESNLRPYQAATVEHIINNTHCGLFLEMGLGKTISTLTAVNRLIYEHLEISNVLIIGPKRVVESVWSDEVEKWAHISHLSASKIIGPAKQRNAALKEKSDVYLISRDNIAWLCGQFGGSMLPFDMLVIDESSSFKNHQSQRFKALRLVQPCFDRIVILTGTPAPNSLIDLWPQIWLLDRGERLGKTISIYRKQYFTPGQTSGLIVYNYRLNKDSDKLIHDRIKDICISMKSEDYLDLPETLDNVIEVKFPPEIQSKYDEFEREQVLSLLDVDEEISALNAAALSNKLLQFANGAVYDEDKNVHEIHDLKLNVVEEIIEEANGQPVLIAWSFRHDLARLQKRLKKYKPRELKTNQDIKDWNDGKIQVLLMHPASGGHGLNLQFGGHIIVWFGQTWSLELYQQFNARLRRPGQQNRVIMHRIVAHKTIEPDVIKAQERKANKQNGLMDAVKARLNKHVKCLER